jgi:fission process protein 1
MASTNHHEHLIHHEKNHFDTLDSNMRYLAFFRPLAPIIRYAAYVSDIGEAFRPVVNKWLVRGSYGISWGYVVGDVAYEGYTCYNEGQRGKKLYRNVSERIFFQSFASMIFPAFTIHTVVHQTKNLFKSQARLQKFSKWGPTFCGLAVIPMLPFMYDHPVEIFTQKLFDTCWKL